MAGVLAVVLISSLNRTSDAGPRAAGQGPVNDHFSAIDLTLSCQELGVSSSRSGDRNQRSGREYRLGSQFPSESALIPGRSLKMIDRFAHLA